MVQNGPECRHAERMKIFTCSSVLPTVQTKITQAVLAKPNRHWQLCQKGPLGANVGSRRGPRLQEPKSYRPPRGGPQCQMPVSSRSSSWKLELWTLEWLWVWWFIYIKRFWLWCWGGGAVELDIRWVMHELLLILVSSAMSLIESIQCLHIIWSGPNGSHWTQGWIGHWVGPEWAVAHFGLMSDVSRGINQFNVYWKVS